jgi:prefoldin alpha subunit
MSLGGGGGGQQQLQALAQEIEQLEEEKAAIKGEIEALQTQKVEIDEAVEAIEELETGETVQVPLGGGAYLHAEVGDIDEITVELGAGYAAERSREGAADTLESKKETLDDRIADPREEIAEIDTEMENLEQRAQQMQQQQLQQMQQQRDE